MHYNESTNAWDEINNARAVPFCAENDRIFQDKEILSSEQEEKVLEIMDSLNKNGGWMGEGEIEMGLSDDAAASKHSIKRRKACAEDDEVSVENAILSAQNELSALLDHLEPKSSILRERITQTARTPSAPSHVSNLINDTKYQLAGMKAFATFAKDKFRDPGLGMRYQKTFLRRIDKAMALLSSYGDYLSVSNPVRKTNTINDLLEKVLTKHTVVLNDQRIEIIKKQFSEDLPETTVPEAQLEYILDSLIQYITHSTSPHGNLGLLTRLVDDTKGVGEGNDAVRVGQNYVEILFVFSTPDKKSDRPSSNHRGQGMDLILLLVQEIIQKNKGLMEVKPTDKNGMTFIFLRVPVDQ